MGINAIRELCNRNIFSMEETLLENLLDYRTHKDKGVFMAARSLLTLFRDKNPGLLYIFMYKYLYILYYY